MQRVQYHYIILRAILILGFLTSGSFGSWKPLGKLPVPIGCCFFLTPNQGVIGSGHYNTPTPISIFVTTNGGITWTLAGTPAASGQVTQIAIRSDGTGYASIFSPANPTMNLWSTSDGGYSWKDISSGSHYGTGVGVTSTAMFTSQWSAPISPGNNTNGVFVMDDAHVLITKGPNSVGMGEAWGAYGDSVHHIWYVVTELSRQLLISTDLGLTWKLRFNFGSMMTGGNIPTGEIIGFGDALYVQTEADGIFRGSLSDTGATWHRIGGPSNAADTRTLYASGCTGQNVMAFDNTGGLWLSDDGGDGTLAKGDPLKIQHINFLSISSCATAIKKATITNTGCIPYVVSNVALLNNGAGVFSLLPPLIVPDTLAVGATDTFTVLFNPNLKSGTYNSQIRVQGYFEAAFGEGEVAADSNIRIAGVAVAEPPKIQTNLQEIHFGDVSLCESGRDSVLTIKNIGCDTLEIISGPASLDSVFLISNIIFPFILLPDSEITIHIHFKPLILGPVSVYLTYRVSSQGRSNDITFYIDGNGISGAGILSYPFQTFDFDTLSICIPDSVSTFITNIGCGPLVVKRWELIGCFVTGDGIAPGTILLPGDTIHYRIYLGEAHTRLYKGSDTGHFFIEFSGGFPAKNLYISVKGFIGDGTHVLSTSPRAIDFGITSLCEEKDSLITLHNTGCDTLAITNAELAGSGFVVPGISFPIIILPDDSTQIKIFTLLDTAGGKLISTDSLKMTSNSDSVFAPIKLTRTITPHREVGMYLDATPQSGTGFNVVSYNLKETPGKSLKGAQIQKINFGLAYNTDLLEFLPSKSSANLQSSDGKNFTMNSSGGEIGADANGILASVAFEVYLTKDSTTTIGLTGVKINGIDTAASPCAVTMSFGGSAEFDYNYLCGERSIARFMRGESIVNITFIAPNPARDEIEVGVHALQEQDAKIEIVDALGIKVLSVSQHVAAGTNAIHLKSKDLSAGLYLIRILSSNGSASQKFMKIR